MAKPKGFGEFTEAIELFGFHKALNGQVIR
jgi:hypothetical protein